MITVRMPYLLIMGKDKNRQAVKVKAQYSHYVQMRHICK